MIAQTEVATYSTATVLAGVFEAKSRKILELHDELNQQIQELNTQFKGRDNKAFRANITICGADSKRQIQRELKRVAWRTLMEKLGIRKFMSTAKVAEMDAALSPSGSGSCERESDPVDKLPEISEDNILLVLHTEASRADEYLTEKVKEVYDWLKPYVSDTYKTNEKNRWKVSEKIIKSYAVERSSIGFRVSYGRTGDMIQALDIVMHLLDGKGIPESYYGPLCSAINDSPTGVGQTEYVAYRCFQNRNIHLKLKRRDLVDEFNFRCGHERELPGNAAGGRYERSSKQTEEQEIQPGKDGNFDLFETPESLAEQMCELAGIVPGMTMLEPSAGKGRIVRAAQKLGAKVTAVEVQHGLFAETCDTYETDFLKLDALGLGPFDCVVMNPPFSRGQDARHIRHAATFLRPGGTLVAIASAGVMFRSDRNTVAFREWLTNVDATVTELPANTFKESGTGVNTVMILIKTKAE